MPLATTGDVPELTDAQWAVSVGVSSTITGDGLKPIDLLNRNDGEHRLSTTITALGPTYVKLGQFLATRPDVVGPALARDLESLQDRMPPFSQGEAENAVAAALEKKLSDVFVAFGPPVAAASIAQVHRAEIETPAGRRAVAVKVLRPGIEARFKARANKASGEAPG